MATKPICKIDGCDKASIARGWCRKHYMRVNRTGSVEIKKRGKGCRFLDKALSFAGDACLDWPFYIDRHGYGKVRFEGTPMAASRAVCILAHGAPQEEGLEAAHKCGNRACVNPAHIYWATPLKNASDRISHGTHPKGSANGNAKLSEADVAEAKRRKARGESQAAIARHFGVTRQAIHGIFSGRNWAK